MEQGPCGVQAAWGAVGQVEHAFRYVDIEFSVRALGEWPGKATSRPGCLGRPSGNDACRGNGAGNLRVAALTRDSSFG